MRLRGYALLGGLLLLAVLTGAGLATHFLLPPYGASNWTSDKKAESVKRGTILVGKIKEFRVTHGRYPRSLDELVPAYLGDIPTPIAGDGKWRYRASGEQFYLQFATSSGYPSCNYHLQTDEWYEDS